ncbi:MAG: twin-arginine translocase TatA/TatE family subunit [Chloroflexi bacterium]|nr:twin-arginine translocase TatA/TatE family subunit [Chloroflexota bacterium]
MTLFGIGPGELILILILALIVFGPNRLPEVARTIGKTLNEFRKTSEEVTSAVARELDLSEAASKAGSSAPTPPPAIQPVHGIPLSSVGQVVQEPSPVEGEKGGSDVAAAGSASGVGPGNPDEGSPAQDE